MREESKCLMGKDLKLLGDQLSDWTKAILWSPPCQGKQSHVFSAGCPWLCLMSVASTALPQRGSCPSLSWPGKAALSVNFTF